MSIMQEGGIMGEGKDILMMSREEVRRYQIIRKILLTNA